MIARNAGIESKPSAGDLPRRFSSGEPTLVAQGMAAPREIVVRSAPARVPPRAVDAAPAFSAAAAGASTLR